MLNLRQASNVNNPHSFSNRMRAGRFAKFETLMHQLERPVTILDVGGTIEFWKNRGLADVDWLTVTVGNLIPHSSDHANLVPVILDACAMPQFADQSFDIVFSNSVIEHLFTWENQLRMASEVRRIGKSYWVQTPNYWFPMEPHFHVVGWQWLPERVRVELLRRRRCGWLEKIPDLEKARTQVREVRLMTASEMRRAFPAAKMFREKFGGITKSFVAYDGFGEMTI